MGGGAGPYGVLRGPVHLVSGPGKRRRSANGQNIKGEQTLLPSSTDDAT